MRPNGLSADAMREEELVCLETAAETNGASDCVGTTAFVTMGFTDKGENLPR
jgi:hypothetical protein